jgi:hypothetical protein
MPAADASSASPTVNSLDPALAGQIMQVVERKLRTAFCSI